MLVQKKLPDLVANSQLIWIPSRDMGWSPAPPIIYSEDYWQNYRELDSTDMGASLTDFRVSFVRDHFKGEATDIVDVGIGGGAFVEKMGCRGLDVNHSAIAWLMDQGKLCEQPQLANVLTFWDSFEHIPDHENYLGCADWIFMSLPIFSGYQSCLQSKHFKPGEHIWYWTHLGLINYMQENGYTTVSMSVKESALGREDIKTYAFKRVD